MYLYIHTHIYFYICMYTYKAHICTFMITCTFDFKTREI